MGQATSTLVIELVVVSMAVAVGAVLMADIWPSPDLPLYWMGGAAAVFFVYAIVAAVRDLRKMLQAHRDEAPDAVSEPSQEAPRQTPASEAAQVPATADASAEMPDATESSKPALVIGAPSEEATEFLSVEALRQETADDNTTSKMPTVPLFAESSMYTTAELAAGAKSLQEEEGSVEPEEDA